MTFLRLESSLCSMNLENLENSASKITLDANQLSRMYIFLNTKIFVDGYGGKKVSIFSRTGGTHLYWTPETYTPRPLNSPQKAAVVQQTIFEGKPCINAKKAHHN